MLNQQDLNKFWILLLWPSFIFHACFAKEYYIKPSVNSSCHNQNSFFTDTLEQFIEQIISDTVSVNTTLVFHHGSHRLASNLAVNNASTFSMIAENATTKSVIIYSGFVTLSFTNVSKVCIMNLEFLAGEVGVPTANTVALKAYKSSVTISECVFSNFTRTVINTSNGMLDLSECTITQNVVVKGAACFFHDSHVTVNETNFIHNTANNTGIVYANNSTINVSDSNFSYNTAQNFGVLRVEMSGIVISNTRLASNIAGEWGVLFILSSQLVSIDVLDVYDNIAGLSTLDIINSSADFKGDITYINNVGSFFIMDSQVVFYGSTLFFNNTQRNYTNNYERGGAMTNIRSTAHFKSKAIFLDNESWKAGGGISAFGSRIYIHNELIMANNLATERGGAIYLDQSEFACRNICNFSGNTVHYTGGAIHASDSLLFVGSEWKECESLGLMDSSLVFVDNSAKDGGGLYLEATSKIYGPKVKGFKYELLFINNTAQQRGSAIFVNDQTNDAICSGDFKTQHPECFLQIPFFESQLWGGIVQMDGENALFGGLLDRCIVNNDFSDSTSYKVQHTMYGLEYFKAVTNNTDISTRISSHPVCICFCRGKEMDCNYQLPPVSVKKGEEFNVTLVAVDQVNRSLAALISITVNSANSRLQDGQGMQKVSDECTNLTFNVYSPHDNEELILHADDPCQHIGISTATLTVSFNDCTCKTGFKPSLNNKECQCECDPVLISHCTSGMKCNQSTQSLLRREDFWIDYINTSEDGDFIFFSDCPFDYCHPPSHVVSINLNDPNGADAQCAFNRTGLLCGKCKSGFSLSLGTSSCIRCPKAWPLTFIVIILGAFCFGIALVAIILVLNLTVAIGTMHGLIFYANIVAVHKNTFLPPLQANFPVVFISWLNLDTGFTTCFYEGMDTYARSWLHLVLPAYIIALVVMMIFASKSSFRFGKLIGKTNPFQL